MGSKNVDQKSNKQKRKKQHYLPQFYLKGFSREYLKPSEKRINSKYNVWCYDIKKEKIINRHVKKVAQESYYYSWIMESGEWNNDIEELLGEAENIIAPFIRILNDQIIKLRLGKASNNQLIINRDQRFSLLEFLRITLARVPTTIEPLANSIFRNLQNKYPEEHISKNYCKSLALREAMLLGTREYDFVDVWTKRQIWIFYPRSLLGSIITTDSPIVRFNKNGPNGIGYPDTEIYFPLSQNCFLAIMGKEDDQSKIHVKSLDDRRELSRYNNYVTQFATKYLIGRDEDLIRSIVKRTTFIKPPKYVEDLTKEIDLDPKIR